MASNNVVSHNCWADDVSCTKVLCPASKSLLSFGITEDNTVLPLSSCQNNEIYKF